MKKFAIFITLIFIVILLVTLACISGGEGTQVFNTDVPHTDFYGNSSDINLSADVTATFGAEQFHLQLTAIAEQEQP